MERCPKCGQMIGRETRQCPEYKSRPVCIDCCMKCDMYDSDPGTTWPCTFYIVHNHKYHAPLEGPEAHAKVSEIRERISDNEDVKEAV